MTPFIKKLLDKSGKSKSEYLLLLGYFYKIDTEVFIKLADNLKTVYNINAYNLPIFSSTRQYKAQGEAIGEEVVNSVVNFGF